MLSQNVGVNSIETVFCLDRLSQVEASDGYTRPVQHRYARMDSSRLVGHGPAATTESMAAVDYRTQTAHHEAAHAVLAILYQMGLSGGIDLDAATSVDGAFGNAAVNLWDPDPSQSEAQQRMDVVRNLAVICAGAASDAKVLSRSLRAALEAQAGDFAMARQHTLIHPITSNADDGEIDYVIGLALDRAKTLLDRPDVWSAVEAVAYAALAEGGKLEAQRISQLADEHVRPA